MKGLNILEKLERWEVLLPVEWGEALYDKCKRSSHSYTPYTYISRAQVLFPNILVWFVEHPTASLTLTDLFAFPLVHS